MAVRDRLKQLQGGGRAGYQHFNQIEDLRKTIQAIEESFMEIGTSVYVKQYHFLLWEIMKEIKSFNNGWGHRRKEQQGIYFMNQG